MFKKTIANGVITKVVGEVTTSAPTEFNSFTHKGLYKTEVNAPNEEALNKWVECNEPVKVEEVSPKTEAEDQIAEKIAETEKQKPVTEVQPQPKAEKKAKVKAEKKPKEHKLSRVTAGILAILFGSFGAHKFYLGNTKMALLHLAFFWTGIPGIIGIVEGISYFIATDEVFLKRIEEEKEQSKKGLYELFPFIKNEVLPTTLAIVSVGLTLLARFWSYAGAFGMGKILFCFSTLAVMGSVAMLIFKLLKQKTITPTFEMAIQAFAIIILCL